MTWSKSALIEVFQRELPGISAHDMVMGYVRPSVPEVLRTKREVRTSSVVFLIYPKNGTWHFLLLKRHDYAGVHSGQVGLPGGSLEQGESREGAAIRELHEETGLRLEEKDLLTSLSPLYISPSNFIVYPFMALIEEEPTWIFDEREVKKGIEVPLKDLVVHDNLRESQVKMSGSAMRIQVKSFPFGGEVVWGATAMILSECKQIMLNLGE